MLIVEGPDGSGKSTLCHLLTQELGWPIAPRVVDKDTNPLIPSLKRWVEENLAAGFQHTIFDRHRLISEPIYGPIFRGELTDGFDDLGWFSVHWVELMLSQAQIILCLPPLETVLNNLRNDEDNLTVRDKATIVYWQYWALLCRHSSRFIWYDYTAADAEDNLRFLTTRLRSYP